MSKLQLILAFFIVILLSGCGLVKGLRAIKNEDVQPQYYLFKEKTIIFTPLTHFGQKKYYDSLRDSIVHWKNEGFIIFYEQIETDQSLLMLDSISYDILNRKWRRITGGEKMTREGYAELSDVFKDAIV